MRNYDEEDPKKPHPVDLRKKGTNPFEDVEGQPWDHLREDADRDRHRHV